MKDGGPAFPSGNWHKDTPASSGLSLRDYFAAAAMKGYMAGGMVPEGTDTTIPTVITAELVAQRAYQYADAMLAERERSQPQGAR